MYEEEYSYNYHRNQIYKRKNAFKYDFGIGDNAPSGYRDNRK